MSERLRLNDFFNIAVQGACLVSGLTVLAITLRSLARSKDEYSDGGDNFSSHKTVEGIKETQPQRRFSHSHEAKIADRIRNDETLPEDYIQRTRVCVRVPATSANMGPGFDTIGR